MIGSSTSKPEALSDMGFIFVPFALSPPEAADFKAWFFDRAHPTIDGKRDHIVVVMLAVMVGLMLVHDGPPPVVGVSLCPAGRAQGWVALPAWVRVQRSPALRR